MDDFSTLKDGWAFDESSGTAYHFEHFPMNQADELAKERDEIYVLETINWTLADEETVHFNRYYAYGLGEAIAIAAKFEIMANEVAEQLIRIRQIQDDEVDIFLKVWKFFSKQMPSAISEDQAEQLPYDDSE